LPTSPPRCAIRAHKAKFAFPGEFALPIPENSANKKGNENQKAKTAFMKGFGSDQQRLFCF